MASILKYWRQLRKMSQLDLALVADISTKHLSFIETGKAIPSPQLVLKLSKILELPLRDRNACLIASGATPQIQKATLEQKKMAIVRQALQHTLTNHEPYPAMVVNVSYDILITNASFRTVVDRFSGLDALVKYPNIYRLLFAEDGLKPYLYNPSTILSPMLERLRGEAMASQDKAVQQLYEEIDGLYNPPRESKPPDNSDLPVLSLTLENQTTRLSLFSTISTFGTPLDTSVQGLRIDCMFPSDEASKAEFYSW
ncbi:MAG: helix-turn-helix transcriptional regulator [Gammaproteobacteria bacterium]|nr:helix-turn-helix transcriptional regulator [Gammaproteobacteria bacterium]